MARDTTHPGRIRIPRIEKPEQRSFAALAEDTVRSDILRNIAKALRDDTCDPRATYPAARRRDFSGT